MQKIAHYHLPGLFEFYDFYAAFLPVYFYNGKRGISLKYFFYWYYPVHLVLLGILTDYVLPLFR